MGESSRALRKELANFASRNKSCGQHDREKVHDGASKNSGSDDDEWFLAEKQRFCSWPREEDSRTLPFERGFDEILDYYDTMKNHTSRNQDGHLVIKKIEWFEDKQAYKMEHLIFLPLNLDDKNDYGVAPSDYDAARVVFQKKLESQVPILLVKERDNHDNLFHAFRPPCKDPKIQVTALWSKMYQICALCGPRFAFVEIQALKSHLETVHMKSIQREFEILGKCPRCERLNTKIENIALHLTHCYALKGFKVNSESDSRGDQDVQKKLEKTVHRKVVFDKVASTPTQHALNELAKYMQKNPDALKMELMGENSSAQLINGTPATVSCDISCSDLRYCLDSADGDVVKLTKKLTACVIGLKLGRVRNPFPAFEKEIGCIIGFIRKHFVDWRSQVGDTDNDSDGGGVDNVTDPELLNIIVEMAKKWNSRLREKFKDSATNPFPSISSINGESSKAAAKSLPTKLGDQQDRARRQTLPPHITSPPKRTKGAGVNIPMTSGLKVSIMEWDPPNAMYRIEFINSWLNGNSTRECFVRFSEMATPEEPNPVSSTTKETHTKSDSSEWACAICGPTSAFGSHEIVTGHILAKHMGDLHKAFDILRQCPRCQTTSAQRELFTAHAIFCYALKSTTASSEPPAEAVSTGTSGNGKEKLELDLKRMFINTKFNGQTLILTKLEGQEAVHHREGNPGSLTVELAGLDYPPDGVRCEIKYYGLPSVLKSASDFFRLRNNYGPSPKGIRSLSALVAEIDCFIYFLRRCFIESEIPIASCGLNFGTEDP